jgi:hypothetical protein
MAEDNRRFGDKYSVLFTAEEIVTKWVSSRNSLYFLVTWFGLKTVKMKAVSSFQTSMNL